MNPFTEDDGTTCNPTFCDTWHCSLIQSLHPSVASSDVSAVTGPVLALSTFGVSTIPPSNDHPSDPIIHVIAVSTDGPCFLNAAHSIEERKFDATLGTPHGTKKGPTDGTKEGTTKGTKESITKKQLWQSIKKKRVSPADAPQTKALKWKALSCCIPLHEFDTNSDLQKEKCQKSTASSELPHTATIDSNHAASVHAPITGVTFAPESMEQRKVQQHVKQMASRRAHTMEPRRSSQMPWLPARSPWQWPHEIQKTC